jgi:hypothetical protein
MPKPIISITDQQKDKDISQWEPTMTASVKSREGIYAIKADDPWYINSTLSIAYQQNSFLFKSFSIEVTDNRTKYIQQAGSILATIIPFIAAVPPPQPQPQPEDNGLEELRRNLPYNVDVEDCFGGKLDEPSNDTTDKSKLVSCEEPINDRNGKDTGWKVMIVTEHNNKNSSISYEEFFTKDGYSATNFPIPECKEGFVYLQYNNNKKLYSSPITFANPTRLVAIPIPPKGSITYHPICSADSTSSSADIANPLDLIKTTIDQLAAAKKAYDSVTKK